MRQIERERGLGGRGSQWGTVNQSPGRRARERRPRAAEEVAAEEVAGVVGVLLHWKLLSLSLPEALKVTNPTLAPPTLSVIHDWNSETRAKTSGKRPVAQGTP